MVLMALLMAAVSLPSAAQYVPVHLSNDGIYLFMDELASCRYIDLNSLVKPYSRTTIAALLAEAESSRTEMSVRQQAELDFYLKDFMKEDPGTLPPSPAANWLWQKKYGNKRFDAFHYRDTLFQLTVNPIVGADVWVNSNGAFYHWWNGVEAWSCAGRFGFWASLRDNHESVELTARDFQNQRIGGARIAVFEGRVRDYEEFRGGITYGWDWGHVGLIMDQFSWGENNGGSNIFSGRTPAFARIELSLDPVHWFSFRYVHGFLHSEVVDSTQSFWVSNSYGDDYREVYHSKYLAANMFSFIPIKGLQLSVGNSVIYDKGSTAGFLIPLAFFKAIDHAQTAGINNMNSQLFFSASSRNLKHFHFYGTVFIDELSTGRFFNDQEFNLVSYKAGFSSTLVPNMQLVAEYTWTNCLTFRHNVPTTTFESNQYNLGHYLEDNAKDLYIALAYRPYRTLNIKAYLNHSRKGPDHTELGTMPRDEIVPFDPIVWESTRIGVLATIQVVSDLYARLGYEWRNVSGEQEYVEQWTPEEYHGKTGTLRVGLNYGF